jgi:NAD(P)-dependent dehydrogenase (short-subunit alcohol dehydrogenase family)
MSDFRADLLQGKVALVTGGGTGIGKVVARELGLHGAKVVIASRKQDVIAAACEELSSMGIECLGLTLDIRVTETVESVIEQTVEHFGGLDILINNAAGNFPARIEDLSYNAFKTVVDIDLQGTFNMSKAAFTAVMKERGGVLINITAPFEHLGVSWQAHAAAAKAGVISLTRTAAVEWAGLGIRVNGIAPGEIENTEGTDRLGETLTTEGQVRRKGRPEDVANAVLFLASDAGRYINGVNLYVDGGSGADMLKVPVYED